MSLERRRLALLLALAGLRAGPVWPAGPKEIPTAPSVEIRQASLEPGAAALGPPALPAQPEGLQGLNTVGYAVFAPGPLLPEGLAPRLVAGADRIKASRRDEAAPDWTFLDETSRRWRSDGPQQTPELTAEVRTFVEGLIHRLGGALPGEILSARNVWVRSGTFDPSRDLHVDGGFITLTHALRGPGTDIYTVRPDGWVEKVSAGEGHVAALTGDHRAWLTGIPATVHAAPEGGGDERALLMVHVASRSQQSASTEEFFRLTEKAKQRAGAIRRRLELQLRPAPQPPESFVAGLLQKLRRFGK